MSDVPELEGVSEIPTFSECVIGFRAWRADESDRLWPVSNRPRPWAPGINTARCECRTSSSLRFQWTWHQGRRVLEPAPAHDAPDEACACGLYSLRRPRAAWARDTQFSVPPRVVGAVASWGRMQVHSDGFRAEHACVVALGYHEQASEEARHELERIAAVYRVELVPVDLLEQAARRYGTPLPDTLGPQVEPTDPPAATLDRVSRPPDPVAPAPDLAPEQLPAPRGPAGRRTWGLIDPLTRSHRRASLRARAAFLALECCIAVAFIALSVSTYRSEATTSYVQRHGIRAQGYVTAVHRARCGGPYQSPPCVQTRLAVTLTTRVEGLRTVDITYAQYVEAHARQHVTVVVDPHHPHYAELARQPRTSAGVWVIALLLSVVAIAVATLDGRSLLAKQRGPRRTRMGTKPAR